MIARNSEAVEDRLRQTSLYDPTLDLSVEDTEGTVAGYPLFWFDPITLVGLVEPMRVEDRFWRLPGCSSPTAWSASPRKGETLEGGVRVRRRPPSLPWFRLHPDLGRPTLRPTRPWPPASSTAGREPSDDRGTAARLGSAGPADPRAVDRGRPVRPDIWFPEIGGHREAAIARRICRAGPVRAECLDYA